MLMIVERKFTNWKECGFVGKKKKKRVESKDKVENSLSVPGVRSSCRQDRKRTRDASHCIEDSRIQNDGCWVMIEIKGCRSPDIRWAQVSLVWLIWSNAKVAFNGVLVPRRRCFSGTWFACHQMDCQDPVLHMRVAQPSVTQITVQETHKKTYRSFFFFLLLSYY